MEAKILDENPGKKTSQVEATKVGENADYSLYTSQLLDILEQNGAVIFKKGDMFMGSIKNDSPTFKEQLDNWIYKVTGNDYSRAAEHAAMITVDGQKK